LLNTYPNYKLIASTDLISICEYTDSYGTVTLDLYKGTEYSISFSHPEYKESEDIRGDFNLLTPKTYENLSNNIKIKMAIERRDNAIRDATEKVTSKLEKKYNSGKEVIKNSVVYGSNYVIYGTKKIEYKGMKDIILSRGFLNSDDASTISDIFQTIVDNVLLEKLHDKEEKDDIIKVNGYMLAISLAHHKVLINNKRVSDGYRKCSSACHRVARPQ